VSRFQDSKKNLATSAACIGALLRGEEGIDADAGALVMADAVDCLRVVRNALTKRRGPRG